MSFDFHGRVVKRFLHNLSGQRLCELSFQAFSKITILEILILVFFSIILITNTIIAWRRAQQVFIISSCFYFVFCQNKRTILNTIG